MDAKERKLHEQKVERFLKKAEGADPLEKSIEGRYNKVAKRHGWTHRKLQTKMNNGDPDRIYFRKGECFLIEYKRKGKHPTELQLKRQQEFRDQGFDVLVLDYFDPLFAEALFL